MDASRIINALGGTSKVAATLGVTASAVSMWRGTGIPGNRWKALVDHAAAHGIDGITFDALAASKPAPATEAAA